MVREEAFVTSSFTNLITHKFVSPQRNHVMGSQYQNCTGMYCTCFNLNSLTFPGFPLFPDWMATLYYNSYYCIWYILGACLTYCLMLFSLKLKENVQLNTLCIVMMKVLKQKHWQKWKKNQSAINLYAITDVNHMDAQNVLSLV